MKVPNPNYHRPMIHGLLLVFMGMLLGSILLLLYFSKELDSLYTKIIVLENERKNLEAKIELKEKELKSWNARHKINDLIIHVKDAPNEIIETEIHRQVLLDVQFLIGKETRLIQNSYESILEIFSPKIYTIDSKKYRVDLNTMVMIDNKLHLYLKVKPQN